jgi:hypothetical protein
MVSFSVVEEPTKGAFFEGPERGSDFRSNFRYFAGRKHTLSHFSVLIPLL